MSTDNVPAPLSDVPEWMKKHAGAGLQNIETEDLIIPRMFLLQALSPSVIAQNHRAGQVINSVSEEVYAMPLRVVALDCFKTRRWARPRNEGGGVMCYSRDAKVKMPGGAGPVDECAKCPNKEFREGKGKDALPLCTMSYNFPLMIEGSDMPVALQLNRSKLKVGKQLISLVAMRKGAPIFGTAFELSIKNEKNQQGEFYNFAVRPLGNVTEAEFAKAVAMAEFLKGKNVSVDEGDGEAGGDDGHEGSDY